MRRLERAGYLWILPALVVLAGFLFYPIAFTSTLSLFEWNGYTTTPFADFVGLDNYSQLFQDARFFNALQNTLLFVFFAVTVQLGIALLLATFIYLGEFRGSSLLRGVIFFPSVLSAVVVAITWRHVVFLRGGLIHQVTTALGLPDFFPLGNPDQAFFVIIFVALWQGIGFNLVIFYAGLQSLDKEITEAAQIDGAGFWPLIYRVVAPLQAPVILVSAVLNMIGGLQVFDLVFVFSRGPMAATHSTDVLATYMVFNSFAGSSTGGGRSQLGYAASIAVVMMVVMIIFSLLRTRLRRAIDY
jgi:raffinose/stachyose/melibiose transport system permease protein